MSINNYISNKIKFLRIVWCDNANIIRSKAIRIDQPDSSVSVGISPAQQAIPVMYDGVVEGTDLTPVGEVQLVPDPITITPIPYVPGHYRAMGDMYYKGRPWEHSPREFLKRMILKALEKKLVIKGAFENEFYLLKEGGSEPVDNTPFASTYSMDFNQEVIGDMVKCLHHQGGVVEQYYPESGPGQQEITTAFADALKAADTQIVFRETVKATAMKHQLIASFLPKLFPDTAGSGSHLHLSLWENDVNILYQEDQDYGLSLTAQRFLAGIINHLPALMAITTPITNSYRRIKPGMWCGAFQCWGLNNREAAVRVVKEEDGRIEHFELKTLDASANPYIALGAVIAAGLDGLENKMELQHPVQADPARIIPDERKEKNILPLPDNLGLSIQNLEKDTVILENLGPELSTSYLAVKKSEWEFMKNMSLEEEVKLLRDKY